MKRINQHFEKSISLLLIGSGLFLSCGSDDDVSNPNELITTLILTFIPIAGSQTVFDFTVTASFSDPDGDGGNPPTQIDDITLENGRPYQLFIDVTEEIMEEDDEHQFFFTGSILDNGNLEHEYSDQDDNGNPLGLINNITTQTAGTGTFIVTLKHQPDGIKVADPGDITVGDTDIEVSFDMTIQ